MSHTFTGIRGILLDIEGTVAPVSFVYDVMFPFVRRSLDHYLTANWGSDSLRATCDAIARDAQHASFAAWCDAKHCTENAAQRDLVRAEIIRLMDGDIKATGLKRLQGEIWEAGFQSGELRALLFEEVSESLRNWRADGFDLRIYSSGSVHAQKLFFGHTLAGDLTSLLSGYYDTTIGGKKESPSYSAIAAEYRLAPEAILFLSDVAAELDAAAGAGMQTGLVIRPGNAPVASDMPHVRIGDFREIHFA